MTLTDLTLMDASEAIDWILENQYNYVLVPENPTIKHIANFAFNGDVDMAVGHAEICEEMEEQWQLMLDAVREVDNA